LLFYEEANNIFRGIINSPFYAEENKEKARKRIDKHLSTVRKLENNN
jgi:hypothetical protein